MAAEPASVAEVVDRVQIDWAALEYVVSALSEAELTQPGSERWSVKDHLAHVADWEIQLAAILSHRRQQEAFAFDDGTWRRLEAMDADKAVDYVNELLCERSRGLSIAQVKATARRAHAELLAALNALSDADLRRSVIQFAPDARDRPLLDKIAGDSYAHYAEHTGWIKNLLAALR